MPSLEDTFPNTILEAMSCGTPVVAFGAGGIPEIVADGLTGRVVPAGDTARLGRAILDCLRDRGACAKMGEVGRHLVQTAYAMPAQAQRYLDLYTGSCYPPPRPDLNLPLSDLRRDPTTSTPAPYLPDSRLAAPAAPTFVSVPPSRSYLPGGLPPSRANRPLRSSRPTSVTSARQTWQLIEGRRRRTQTELQETRPAGTREMLTPRTSAQRSQHG